MSTALHHRMAPAPRRIPAPEDLQALRRHMQRGRRRRRFRAWSVPRKIAVILLAIMMIPAADAFAGDGVNRLAEATVSRNCRLLSILDGDTLLLDCPGQGVAELDVIGLSAPPIGGAACLAEAWWGLRAEIGLRAQVWRTHELTFIPEHRAHVVMVLADGAPIHRLIPHAPDGLCA